MPPFRASKTLRLQIPKGEDRITATQVLRVLNNDQYQIVGAQMCPGGNAIDVVLKREEDVEMLEFAGLDILEYHLTPKSISTQHTFVSVFLPIEYPDDELTKLLQKYGEIRSIRRLHYKEKGLEAFENGVRVVDFAKLEKPLPYRLSVAGISFGFKYTGQPESCLRCSSMDHTVKACPLQRRKKTRQTPNSNNNNASEDSRAQSEESTPPTVSTDENNTTNTVHEDNNTPQPMEEFLDISSDSDSESTDKEDDCAGEVSPKTTAGVKRSLEVDLSPVSSPSKSKTKKYRPKLLPYEQFQQDIHHISASGCARRLRNIGSTTLAQTRAVLARHKLGPFTDERAKLSNITEEPVLERWRTMDKLDASAKLIELYNKFYRTHYEQ